MGKDGSKRSMVSRIWTDKGLLVAAILLTAGALLLLPYVKSGIEIIGSLTQLSSSGSARSTSADAIDPSKGDKIAIPSIELESPVADDLAQLDRKVVRYAFSAKPGSGGNVVMTAHNMVKYQNPLFSLLFMVKPRDDIAVAYRGRAYTYRVVTKQVVSTKAAEDFTAPTKDERLTLITCYPPTIDTMRLVVVAKVRPLNGKGGGI